MLYNAEKYNQTRYVDWHLKPNQNIIQKQYG